jgi:hypothetical protein
VVTAAGALGISTAVGLVPQATPNMVTPIRPTRARFVIFHFLFRPRLFRTAHSARSPYPRL